MLTEHTGLARGRLLYQQGRYELALRECQQVLASTPDQDEALLLQTYALSALHRLPEALDVTNTLLKHWPDQPIVLELKARVLIKLEKSKEALQCIQEAIHLDPSDADYRCTASVIYFDQKDFANALHHAEEGFRLDPSHTVCLNIRNLCLVKLGRADELHVSIEETLAEDPDNGFSHASAGWALLEKGDSPKARTHFAEALRLSPGLSWAEAGMLQALKAKNPLFKFFLRYYFWMANLKGQQQWAIIISSYIGLRFLNSLDDSILAIKLLQIIAITFVYLTWFVDPIFNVVILTDPQGRHLLSDRQRSLYQYVAVLISISALAALVGFLGGAFSYTCMSLLFVGGLMGLGLVLPLSAWIEATLEQTRKRLRYILFIMGLTVGIALVLLMANTREGLSIMYLFTVEMLLFMFFRNCLLIEKND